MKNIYTYIHIVFVKFVIIFIFIFIYLLHVLVVFKIKGIFEKKSSTQKCAENGSFLYIVRKTGTSCPYFHSFNCGNV